MKTLAFGVVFAVVCVAAQAAEPGPLPAVECRVENAVYSGDGQSPVSRSTTLFRGGVVWDFKEPSEDTGADAAEIALHDPARGRIVLIDPDRNVKTVIEIARLERLAASLATWARGADDDVIRWAGGPDFDESIDRTDSRIDLSGPRVRYAVAIEEAPSREAAAAYRKFADTAALLKALVHPGGLPPFPRMAVNERVAEQAAVPGEVVLEIDSRYGVPGTSERLRSTHKLHPRLLASDIARIERASARLAVAREVPLAEYLEKE